MNAGVPENRIRLFVVPLASNSSDEKSEGEEEGSPSG
jgi:hypothetical protein